jgi:hypothetical protein
MRGSNTRQIGTPSWPANPAQTIATSDTAHHHSRRSTRAALQHTRERLRAQRNLTFLALLLPMTRCSKLSAFGIVVGRFPIRAMFRNRRRQWSVVTVNVAAREMKALIARGRTPCGAARRTLVGHHKR